MDTDFTPWLALAGGIISSVLAASVAIWVSAKQAKAQQRTTEIELDRLRADQQRQFSERKLDIAYRYAELRQKGETVARDFLNEISKETAIGFLYLDDDDSKRKIWLRDNSNLLVGRREGCDVVLPNGHVSREHCVITVAEGKAFLVPLHPTNPVMLNGKEIACRCEIRPDDVLMIRPYVFRYFSLL